MKKTLDVALLKANKSKHPEVIRRIYGRLVEKKVAKRYTTSQEIAFIRQKDRKPEEYAEYDAFVEQCKREVKEMLEIEEEL